MLVYLEVFACPSRHLERQSVVCSSWGLAPSFSRTELVSLSCVCARGRERGVGVRVEYIDAVRAEIGADVRVDPILTSV